MLITDISTNCASNFIENTNILISEKMLYLRLVQNSKTRFQIWNQRALIRFDT